MPDPSVPHWHVIVPVKAAVVGKSRLGAPAGVRREELARALAQDTIAAVLGVPAVADLGLTCLVVTSDRAVAGWAEVQGARVLADPGGGLNAAASAGLHAVPPGSPAAVLLADLPAATSAELATALAACARVRQGFVPDATGRGTVLLGGTRADALRPRFGPGSAQAHRGAAQPVGLDLRHLRQDVDTAADLAAALDLGVGRHTRAVVSPATGRSQEQPCEHGHRTGDGVEGPCRR